MSDVLLFAALALSSYRVWRLIGKDDITEPIRARIFSETHGAVRRYLHDLITCAWCAGTWVSLAAVYATHRWLVRLSPHWLLWAVAVAAVVGLIDTWETR